LTHPVRLDARAAADIKEAYAWHEAKEPGLGDTFLERLNETITRIAQNPLQYALVVADVRRARLKKFLYGVWYRVKPDGSVVIACLHQRQDMKLARARASKPEPSP
jgi:plasmid stabilization system protein ParE